MRRGLEHTGPHGPACTAKRAKTPLPRRAITGGDCGSAPCSGFLLSSQVIPRCLCDASGVAAGHPGTGAGSLTSPHACGPKSGRPFRFTFEKQATRRHFRSWRERTRRRIHNDRGPAMDVRIMVGRSNRLLTPRSDVRIPATALACGDFHNVDLDSRPGCDTFAARGRRVFRRFALTSLS